MLKLRRFLSCTLALLLAVSMPLAALAEEYDLAIGDISINADESGQYVTQEANGINNHKEEYETVITQTITEAAPSTTNTITITAEQNTTAEVTIQDVNINTSSTGEAAITVSGKGNVTIELDGENTVQSGMDHAGVEKNTTSATDTSPATGTGNLTITDENDTGGSLKATGGLKGAGIGGGANQSASDITITGNAQVEANGGNYGAGIGGGYEGEGSNITIGGSAKVDAQGNIGSAGIGGGYRGEGSNITIGSSAEVDAQGGKYGAGIGGGYGGGGNNIIIEGNAQVKAHNIDSGAGIGGGLQGEGNNITITGNAQVEAQGGLVGAGIGDGFGIFKKDTNITISENAQVKVQGGKIDSEFDYGAGAAIGTSGHSKNIPGEEVEVDTGDTAPTDSYGLYAGALDEGWIAKYEPTADMGKDIPTSLIYGDGEGTVTISKETDTITIAVAADPTCTEAGNQAGFSVNDSLVAVSIPATGHSFTNYVYNDNATCTTDGTETANCEHDGCKVTDTRTKAGSVLGHKFTNYVYDSNATCTEDGTETANCDHTGCKVTDTRTKAGSVLGHKFTNYVYNDNATCTEDGTETANCDHTGCKVTDTRTAKDSVLGHSFTNYVSNKDATYENDGTKTAKCDRCDETDTLPDPGSKLTKPVAAVEFNGIDETSFWKNVVEQIQSANPGDTIEVNAGGICTIPYWVIDAAVERGVTLSIHWRCGEDFIIDRQPDQQFWVYSFTTLPQMLAK